MASGAVAAGQIAKNGAGAAGLAVGTAAAVRAPATDLWPALAQAAGLAAGGPVA